MSTVIILSIAAVATALLLVALWYVFFSGSKTTEPVTTVEYGPASLVKTRINQFDPKPATTKENNESFVVVKDENAKPKTI